MPVIIRIEEILPNAEAAETYLHDFRQALESGRKVHHFEYGVRIEGGRILDIAADRHAVEALLDDYRTTWPEARMVRRAVYQDDWEEDADAG
jgi:hypothetical protein